MIYIHQLAFCFNCPATTICLFPSSPSLYANADNFHVNFNVNKNTDVSFNTLPRLRANCMSSRGCQRDYLCVSASGGLFQASPRKDFNKLIYIPRWQPFCKLHSAPPWSPREDWPIPERTTPMNCCHFNEPVLIICDRYPVMFVRKALYWKSAFHRILGLHLRNLRWITRRKNYLIVNHGNNANKLRMRMYYECRCWLFSGWIADINLQEKSLYLMIYFNPWDFNPWFTGFVTSLNYLSHCH